MINLSRKKPFHLFVIVVSGTSVYKSYIDYMFSKPFDELVMKRDYVQLYMYRL